MIRAGMLALLWMALGPAVPAERTPAREFATLAICVDSGSERLAAWQVELSVSGGSSEIVGIEGAAEPFTAPAYYDARALRRGRIVLAAFSTSRDLRSGTQQVAIVHVVETGSAVDYSVKLGAAGNDSGKRIVAEAWWSRNDCNHRSAG